MTKATFPTNPGADGRPEQEAVASPAKAANRRFDSSDRGLKLFISEPEERHQGSILVHDEALNDIAEFYHNEHATVDTSYETALALAKKLTCDVAQSAREEALEAAALDFIAKVERGEARSTKSYAAFKAALDTGLPTADDVRGILAQSPAAPVEADTKSAPDFAAPQNSAERPPSSDAAEAGADTHLSAATEQATGRYEFPYNRTFQAIAAATSVYAEGVGVNVSVKAFQEAFNSFPDAQPLSEPQTVKEPSLRQAEDCLKDWLRYAEENLSEFDVEDGDCCEEKLCPKCENSGCIQYKIRETRVALASLAVSRPDQRGGE